MTLPFRILAQTIASLVLLFPFVLLGLTAALQPDHIATFAPWIAVLAATWWTLQLRLFAPRRLRLVEQVPGIDAAHLRYVGSNRILEVVSTWTPVVLAIAFAVAPVRFAGAVPGLWSWVAAGLAVLSAPMVYTALRTLLTPTRVDLTVTFDRVRATTHGWITRRYDLDLDGATVAFAPPPGGLPGSDWLQITPERGEAVALPIGETQLPEAIRASLEAPRVEEREEPPEALRALRAREVTPFR